MATVVKNNSWHSDMLMILIQKSGLNKMNSHNKTKIYFFILKSWWQLFYTMIWNSYCFVDDTQITRLIIHLLKKEQVKRICNFFRYEFIQRKILDLESKIGVTQFNHLPFEITRSLFVSYKKYRADAFLQQTINGCPER